MEQINREALFCDETNEYRIPCEADEGDTVTLLFRTDSKSVDAVYYMEYDETQDAKHTIQRRLTFSFCDDLFDYYETAITLGAKPVRYYFCVKSAAGDVCFYNRMGVDTQPYPAHAFCITPGFHVPEWIKGAVMYQIYVDRFCNGDKSNDVVSREYIYINTPVVQVEDWNAKPEAMDVGRFYGGDLQGVWDKLDYIKSLKVEVIYLNPIFVSPSNHKYDCQDYDHIDPHFAVIEYDEDGLVNPDATDNTAADKYMARTADPRNLEASNAFFARFVEAAHEKGLRVILDGVFNHCGSFNKWLDEEMIYDREGGYPDGAFVSNESPYKDYFKFQDQDAWPENPSYEGWWGHETLPKLNYEGSSDLYHYMLEIGKKWVSPPYNVDGWRLDVAADLGRSSELNHQFWKDFRKAVKEANPQAVILAEHYGDPSNWLKGDEWDTVMNYDAFMEPVSWFLTGMEKHSSEVNEALIGDGQSFFNAMKYHMCKMQTPSLMAAMNELSNHDHSRFLTRTNRKVGKLATDGWESAEQGVSYASFRQGVVMCMTWPGAPTIYYGDETGVCGWTDPDNRRTYPWGNENQELIEFHRYMTGIHQRTPALRTGSLKQLYAGKGIIVYGRFTSDSKCAIAVSTEEKDQVLDIPVWQLGVTDDHQMCRQMLTGEEGYNAGFVYYQVKNGYIQAEIPARGSIVITSV